MGYDLCAFVARQGTFSLLSQTNDRVAVAPISCGLELMLCDWHLDKVLGIDQIGAPEDERTGLPDPLIEQVRRWSIQTPIAYLNANFFGGNGCQRAFLWKDGQLLLTPSTNDVMTGHSYPVIAQSELPINTVLRALGVQVAGETDEFDTAGLWKYRHNEDWFAAFTPYSECDYGEFDYESKQRELPYRRVTESGLSLRKPHNLMYRLRRWFARRDF